MWGSSPHAPTVGEGTPPPDKGWSRHLRAAKKARPLRKG
jgi:hypothetical protein